MTEASGLKKKKQRWRARASLVCKLARENANKTKTRDLRSMSTMANSLASRETMTRRL